jgi:hypothetical protein
MTHVWRARPLEPGRLDGSVERTTVEEALHPVLRRPGVDAAMREPGIVEERAAVALARVAQQCRTAPCSPRAVISPTIRAAAHMSVPVEPPQERPMRRERTRAAAMLAASGTA